MTNFQWPVDEDGRPMALVSNGAKEKIGLPNYSSVDVGPAQVTKFVADNPEAISAGLVECLVFAEEVLAEERDAVKAMVTGK